MRSLRTLMFSALALLVTAGMAGAADKASELEHFQLKPWELTDLPAFNQTLADVNETEPNDACPGESYTPGDVFHGAINPGGDLDWIFFIAASGDMITIGTDVDGALPTVDTVIELYANDCSNLLTSNDDGGPGLYSLISDFPAPYTGIYALKIRAFGGTSTGNYVAIGSVSTPVLAECPLQGFDGIVRTEMAAIPDNDPAGVEFGPIKFWSLPYHKITDIVIDLEMQHTWVGDLVVTLKHVSNANVVTTVDLIQRPGVPASTFGCSGNLVSDAANRYFFGTDPTLPVLGEDDCPATILQQCYAVAPENTEGLDRWFNQGRGNGEWYLIISDNAAGDTGTLDAWSVHLQSEYPTATEEGSWGSLKLRYQ